MRISDDEIKKLALKKMRGEADKDVRGDEPEALDNASEENAEMPSHDRSKLFASNDVSSAGMGKGAEALKAVEDDKPHIMRGGREETPEETALRKAIERHLKMHYTPDNADGTPGKGNY